MSTYDDEYATCARTFVTLRVYPGDLTPKEVTERLGLEPTRIQLRGSINDSSTQRPRINAWFLSSKDVVSSRDLRRHLDWLLDAIEPAIPKLFALKSLGARFDIICFWEGVGNHGGPTLSHPQLERLARTEIELGFDLYHATGG